MVKISTNYNYEEIIHKFVVLSIARLDKYQFACRNGNKSHETGIKMYDFIIKSEM